LFYKNVSNEANNDEENVTHANASIDDEAKSTSTFHTSYADHLAIKTFQTGSRFA